jgi:hypothetical protein
MLTERNVMFGGVVVGTTEATSDPFPFQDMSGGFIHVPATEGTVTLTFYVSDNDHHVDDAVDPPTFQLAKTYSGGAISVTLDGGESCEIHPSLFSACQFKIVADIVSVAGVRYKVTAKS